MKPITNALLVAAIICYVFLPFYELSFEGSWTGLTFTSETITNAESLLSKVLVLVPFVSCFGGIVLNCMKSRYWGILSSIFILAGIFFYYTAKDFTVIENPQLFSITELGYGFNLGFGLLIASLISAILSILPFSFNRLHEKRKKGL